MSEISKDLLWKAWPDGYLAMRGVSTVGGYRGLGQDDRGFWWMSHSDESAHQRDVMNFVSWRPVRTTSARGNTARRKGDLLPSVDPADTATWACLLRDLAEVCAYRGEAHTGKIAVITALSWCQITLEENDLWELGVWSGKREWHQRISFFVDTDDPAEALVRARIQLREKADQ